MRSERAERASVIVHISESYQAQVRIMWSWGRGVLHAEGFLPLSIECMKVKTLSAFTTTLNSCSIAVFAQKSFKLSGDQEAPEDADRVKCTEVVLPPFQMSLDLVSAL